MDEKLLLGFMQQTVINFEKVDRVIGIFDKGLIGHKNDIEFIIKKHNSLCKQVSKISMLTGAGLVLSAVLIWSLQQQVDRLQTQIDAIKKEQNGTDVDQEV